MMELARPEEPDFLRENSERWGQEYAEKKTTNRKYQFSWKPPGRQSIVEALEPMSKHHCCYCDGSYPLGGSGAQDTIDHFRPKGLPEFYHLAYEWTNLFLACNECQTNKGSKFYEDLLKPDNASYQFETYFVMNYANGEIQANPNASSDEQRCAKTTICTLGLNKKMRPHARLIEYKHYRDALRGNPDTDIDTFNFRFFLR